LPNTSTQIRILGGQVCAFGSMSDNPGYYTTSVSCCGPPLPITSMPGYDGSGHPPGWRYDKSPWGTGTNGTFPSGEFVDPRYPFAIERLFPGHVNNAVEQHTYGDGYRFQIGSTYYDNVAGSCTGGWPSSVSGPQCVDIKPNPDWISVNPGDPVGFSGVNVYRPNNDPYGLDVWDSAYVQITVGVTACRTANDLANMYGASIQHLVDYHPTSDGNCTPAVPDVNGFFQSNGTANQTVNVNLGQPTTIYFDYNDNNGQPNSKEINPNCSTGTIPAGLSSPGPNCPTNFRTNNPSVPNPP